MKTLRGLQSYPPAEHPTHAVQLLSSAQPLISSSLSAGNAATLGHPSCAASIKSSARDVLCVRPSKNRIQSQGATVCHAQL